MADTTRIPIALDTPAVSHSQGLSYWAPEPLATATPDFDMGAWQMDEDSESWIYGRVNVPNTIGGTPAAKIILIIAANDTAGTKADIGINARPIANDGEALDQALDTTVAYQSITMPTTAYETVEASFTLPTSGNGFPVAAKDQLLVGINRDADDATNDTLNAKLLIVGAYLEIDLS